MSNCETIRDELKAYADNQLSLVRKAEVALHLAGCAACRQEVEAILRIANTIRALDAEPLDLDMRARILDRIADGDREETAGRRG